MKPALFYAIKRGYREYRIIAVTTEKPRNWHGRNVTDNTATHGTTRELIGRFDTQEAAQAKVDQVAKIIAHHAPIIDAASAALNRAHRKEQDAIDAALGIKPDKARMHVDV